jgi:ABC-type sugar transport system ATPase subunit
MQAADAVNGPEPVLKIVGVSKSFGHVQALIDLDLTVYAGEILALVGDNGAGKSTLVKILSGVYSADSGDIRVDDIPLSVGAPGGAQSAGIATVFQDLALVDVMDVASNIYLGHEPRRLRCFVNRPQMYRDAREVLTALRSEIPSVKLSVSELSGGQRQAVAIARSVAQQCRVLLLDEPTAALGVEQQAKISQLILSLKQIGTTIILISHNMEHVFEVADRIAVIRRGRLVGVRSSGETNRSEIIGMITGMKMEAREKILPTTQSSAELLAWLQSREARGAETA